jgi:hypothetical protein
MPRAPLTQQPQVIPIVTKADWASASRALGIPDESAERIEILQKDLVFFLVTAGVKKTPGQSIHVTEVRRLPDRSGLVFRIFEDENPIGAPRGVTEYPYILIGLSVKDVLPVDSCVGRRYEVWPAVLHTSYRNP